MARSGTKKLGTEGFTLIEMLVVIGLIALLTAIPLFMNINNYRGEAFRGEISSLGVALQTARANSFNNINEKKHGVAIHPDGYDGYIIFEGNTYATADHDKDVSIKASYEMTLSPASPTEIVFEQLSGSANYDGSLTFSDGQRNLTATIDINHEGKISW